VRAHAHLAIRSPPIALQVRNQPRTHDREGRCLALIDAANAVFAERGYDAATTRQIAERAGCAEGLIHRYFSGKRGLLLAILETKAVHIVDEFESELPDRESVLDEITNILVRDLDLFWERRDFMRVSVSQATIDPEVGRTISADINNQRVRLTLAKLRRHQQAGRIRAETDIEAIAHAISSLGFSVGFIFQACFGEDRALARRIVTEAASAISEGITQPERNRP
jgi:AcrR family transcriptional regulator